jgi:hypothetical protein
LFCGRNFVFELVELALQLDDLMRTRAHGRCVGQRCLCDSVSRHGSSQQNDESADILSLRLQTQSAGGQAPTVHSAASRQPSWPYQSSLNQSDSWRPVSACLPTGVPCCSTDSLWW